MSEALFFVKNKIVKNFFLREKGHSIIIEKMLKQPQVNGGRNIYTQGSGTALQPQRDDAHQNSLVLWTAELHYCLCKTSAYCTDLST